MYMHYNSNTEQRTLNVHQVQATLAEGLKTQQVRALIDILTGKQLSAYKLVKLAKSEQPELLYSQGKLTIRLSSKKKKGRYQLWDVVLLPTSYLVA